LLLGTASLLQQPLVHLPDQPVREREPLTQALDAVLQRRHATRHLHDIVERHTGRLVELEQQEV
jgi:hypothetical protein